MPHPLDSEFVAFHRPASGGTDKMREVTLNVASREVSDGCAEPGDPTDLEEFEERKEDAIIFLARYLWETEGYKSGTSLSGVSSASYGSSEEIRRIVGVQMGRFAKSSRSGGGKSVRIV